MGVTGVVAIGVPGLLQRSPQWRNEVSLLRIFSLFILLSPLESSLKLSNHYNAYNVFTRFLTKCAMFHLHCKLYINAIVLHISFCDTFSYKVCNVLLTL